MRFFLFLFINVSIFSCGKNPSEIKTDANKRPCIINLQTNRCDSIQGNETSGIEILETVLEVPIHIEGQEITFLSSKSTKVFGKKMNCEINILKKDLHRFALRQNKLLILSPEGSFEFENQTQASNLESRWVWKGIAPNGVLEIRQLYFIGKNKLILRKTCEL